MNRRTIVRDMAFQVATDAENQNDGRTLEGYAAVFDADTEINSYEGKFTERLARGAFAKTLSEKKPVCQYNHGRDSRIGTVPIGTFTSLREDTHGLAVAARLHDNDTVTPVRQAIAAGDISGMSFSFNVVRDAWTDGKGNPVTGRELSRMLFDAGDRGPLQRTIKEVRLIEAGPVLYPAYAQTSVGVRSADELDDTERQEITAEYLRSAGLSDDDSSGDLTVAWLESERAFRWLEAENIWRWLDAEAEYKTSLDEDAAKRTSESTPPDNAAADGTLNRDLQKDTTGASKAPETRKRIMNLAELRERLAVIAVRLEELGTEYRDKEMDAEREAEFDGLKTERTSVTERIAKIEARLEEFKVAASDEKKTERTGDARGTRAKTEDIFDLEAIRRDSYSDEDFRGRMRDNAMRANDEFHFGGGKKIAREDAQEQIEHFLDDKDDSHGTFAKRVLETGKPAYERAWAKAVAAGTPQVLFGEEARAMSLGSDGAGGFAVPVQLDPTIIWTSAGVLNPLRQLARVEQIVGKEWQGNLSSGTTVTRSAEASEAADNSFTMTQKVLRTNRVTGFVPFSYESEEAWKQVRSEITFALGDAKDREEANSFTLGDGSTGFQPGGVIGSLSGNTVAAGGSVAFAAADVYALENALDVRYWGNASFLGSKSIYNLIRQFDTAGGAQLWERIGAGQPGELLGYQAHVSNQMAAAPLVAGKKILAFGDFSNFLILDRIGMSVELVPHVFGSNQRPTGQRGIYAIWMNNSRILVDAAFKVLTVTA